MICPKCKKEVSNNKLLESKKLEYVVEVDGDEVAGYSATCPECGGTVYFESVPKLWYNGRNFLYFNKKEQQ